MMTIASIDTVTEPMAPETSQTVPEVDISAESVGAFQQAMSGPLAENENLGTVLREAMVSVSTVLAQVEPTVAPTVAAPVSPVVVRPLPMLVTENAALGQTLQAEKVIVENLLPKIEIKIVTKVVEQSTAAPTVTPDPSVVSSPLAAPVVVQPLPVQVTENVKLGETLAAATVVVGETLAKVETVAAPIAVEQPASTPTVPSTIAPTVSPIELTADATPHVSLVPQDPQVPQLTPDAAVVSTPLATPVVVQPLPAQLTENVKLGETLTAATVEVGEALAKVESAVTQTATIRPDANVAAPVEVAPAVVQSVAQTVEPVAAQPVADQKANPAWTRPLPAQVKVNLELGASLAAAATAVGEAQAKVDVAVMGGAKSTAPASVPAASEDDAATVPAEAPVAAGVTSPGSVQASAAPEAPQPPVTVAPVDVVRVQAAATAPTDVLIQAAESVADTLLVSPGLLRGQGEVLVKLRPDVLDGTEVKIAVTGRQLEVVFQPHTVDMAVLIENCRTQLVQHLADRIVSFNVSVDVRKKRETA